MLIPELTLVSLLENESEYEFFKQRLDTTKNIIFTSMIQVPLPKYPANRHPRRDPCDDPHFVRRIVIHLILPIGRYSMNYTFLFYISFILKICDWYSRALITTTIIAPPRFSSNEYFSFHNFEAFFILWQVGHDRRRRQRNRTQIIPQRELWPFAHSVLNLMVYNIQHSH